MHCHERDNAVLGTYVSYAKNSNIRTQSSSGGIFSVLAEIILLNNGVVVGAAFDENMLVRHILVSRLEDLDKLRGSKYLQSNIGNIFLKIQQLLISNRLVLFSGTECQIVGLKKFLGKEYENLYTIDILCHGVPSPKVWRTYLNEQEKNFSARAMKVSFRNKVRGWKEFSLQIVFDNGEKYEEIFTKDRYMKFFLRNISLRPSCYKCKFKLLNRESDISLGDCWGIDSYMPDMDDDKGTSIILIHSLKGKRLFNKCKDKLIYSVAETDLVLPPYSDSRISVTMHKNREKFFIFLNKGKSTEKLVKLVENSHITRISFLIKKYTYYFLLAIRKKIFS